MKRITLLADTNSYTGFGLHAIQIARDLTAAGYYVAIRAASRSEAFGAIIPPDIKQRLVSGPQPEPWEILLHPPNFVPTPGKLTAYFTMSETTKLPPMGASLLNRAEVVIVPTIWNASCYSACGVIRPLRIVPLGINTDIFNWKDFPEHHERLVTFGAAGRMAHGGVRKGLNEVIAAFGKAFPKKVKDVKLRVKCWQDCPINHVKDPRVDIIQGHLSEQQLMEWFASLTCFVSAARGEGFGLMQCQALSVGRPIISVKFGGVAEFFDETCGYVLPYRLEPAKFAYANQGHWAEPAEDDLVEAMRMVHHDRLNARGYGAAAAKKVAHLSWRASNDQLINVLKEFGAL